jgi:hypothetical protein
MPNGKPIVSDLEVLRGFSEPFMVDGVPRDERMAARWGVSIKHVYSVWSKKRFMRMIECGVSFRTGWLTDYGKARLAKLEKIDSNGTVVEG